MQRIELDDLPCDISRMQRLLEPVEIFPLYCRDSDSELIDAAHCLVYEVSRIGGSSSYALQGLILTELADRVKSPYVVLSDYDHSPVVVGSTSSIPGFTEFSASVEEHYYALSTSIH